MNPFVPIEFQPIALEKLAAEEKLKCSDREKFLDDEQRDTVRRKALAAIFRTVEKFLSLNATGRVEEVLE